MKWCDFFWSKFLFTNHHQFTIPSFYSFSVRSKPLAVYFGDYLGHIERKCGASNPRTTHWCEVWCIWSPRSFSLQNIWSRTAGDYIKKHCLCYPPCLIVGGGIFRKSNFSYQIPFILTPHFTIFCPHFLRGRVPLLNWFCFLNFILSRKSNP